MQYYSVSSSIRSPGGFAMILTRWSLDINLLMSRIFDPGLSREEPLCDTTILPKER